MSIGEKIGSLAAKIDMDKVSSALMIGGILLSTMSSLANREATRREQRKLIDEAVAKRLPHETK